MAADDWAEELLAQRQIIVSLAERLGAGEVFRSEGEARLSRRYENS